MDWRTWSKKKLAGIGCLGLVGLLCSCVTIGFTMDRRALSKLPPDLRTATIAARSTAQALRNATDTPEASATAEPSETPRASRTPVPTKRPEATATAEPTDTATATATLAATSTPTLAPATSVPPTALPTTAPAAPLSFAAPVQQAADAGPRRGVPQGTSCPEGLPVKGNQGSNGWIYHDYSSPNYDRTQPEECFATAADAEAAGYRAPRR